MAKLERMKAIIVDQWRDEEMASSACYGVEAYARRWPHVLMVNDWDVWDGSRKHLRREVIGWLNQQGASWDFYHLLDTWGLIGFEDPDMAARFKRRWSGMIKAVPSSSSQGWNPHPLNSSFAPSEDDLRSMRSKAGRPGTNDR